MSTGTILDNIISRKHEDIAVVKNNYTLGDLQSLPENHLFLLFPSPIPRHRTISRIPSSACI